MTTIFCGQARGSVVGEASRNNRETPHIRLTEYKNSINGIENGIEK
jgi:hypothetical protein